MISFEDFKLLYDSVQGEPEFEIYFRDIKETYMIIKYEDHVSFQRCGYKTGSGKFDYPSLDILYEKPSVDGICLKDNWKNISTIIGDSTFDLSNPEELNEFKESRIYH